jgi:hypothetical protein
VALFGILVGMTELISRYRDKPTAPLGTVPGLIYIATNAIASVAALWVLQRQNVNFDFGGKLPPEVGQVLLAGFGTMFLFRSALFVVRVGDSDVAIGPAAVLQIILNSADRACDRLRAGPRSEHVYKIMRGVSFGRRAWRRRGLLKTKAIRRAAVGHSITTKNRRGANRGGLRVCGGQLHKQNGRHCWRPFMHRMDAPFIVEEVLIRPWQAWQRPTLPSLET